MNGSKLTAPADVMGKAGLCSLYLALTTFTSELFYYLRGHANTCGPNGMTLGLEAPVHVYGDTPTNSLSLMSIGASPCLQKPRSS